jgi:hypothetical protein
LVLKLVKLWNIRFMSVTSNSLHMDVTFHPHDFLFIDLTFFSLSMQLMSAN